MRFFYNSMTSFDIPWSNIAKRLMSLILGACLVARVEKVVYGGRDLLRCGKNHILICTLIGGSGLDILHGSMNLADCWSGDITC
jgi:hypothetical protein